MKRLKFSTTIFMLCMLTACSIDEPADDVGNRTALQFNAGIATRVVDNSWQADDAIGVALLIAGTNEVAEGKTNYKYVINKEATGAFQPTDAANTAYFPKDGSEVDVQAYYPYQSGVNESQLISITTLQQQSLPAIDFMTTSRSGRHSSNKPETSLVFEHRLAKIVFKVVKDISTTEIDLVGATVQLQGTPGSAVWSLYKNAFESMADAASIDLIMDAQGTAATAIVIPTAAGKEVQFVLTTQAGRRFVAPLNATDALVSGTINTLTMKISQQPTNITATVKPWDQGIEAEFTTLLIDMPADEATHITHMTLWKGDNTEAAKAQGKLYSFIDGSWTVPATEKPFYAEESGVPNQFYAFHQPADTEKDPVTQHLDILTVGPVSFGDNKLILDFKHALAQLNVVLTRGADFPAEVALDDATVTLKSFVQNNLWAGTTLIQDSQKTDYTLTTTNGLTSTILIVPQSFVAGSALAQVTLKNGNKYVATTSALTLDAGKKHTLTLKLTPTKAVVNITVDDWAKVDAEGLIQLDKMGTNTETGNHQAASNDKLTIATDSGLTATYLYKENNWTSDAPLYWDSFDSTKKQYFQTLIAPWADTTGNNEKDYLIADATIAFGASLDFTFKHAMTQITVKLTKGTGFAADGSDFIVDHLLLKGLLPLTDIATNGTVVLATTPSAITPVKKSGEETYTAIVAPQTLTAGAALVTFTIAEKAYTLNVPIQMASVEKGQNTTITATVNKTRVDLVVNLTPWVDVEYNGGDVVID